MKILSRTVFFLSLALFLLARETAMTQVVNEKTKKRISVGIGMFTDLMINPPRGIHFRTINQGFEAFAMFNVPFGKSPLGFSVGLGVRCNNFYGDFLVKSDPVYTELVPVPDSIAYKKSKLSVTYLELPVEFHFKSKSKISVGVGFKAGMNVNSHTKFKGIDYKSGTDENVVFKYRDIKNIEQFCFGPTLRIGYRWFNFKGYYELSKIFVKGKGPDFYPVSLGFVLMPF
jgi:hypothetical protein